MEDRNILFSVFDRQKGSVPIYYTGLSEEEAVHITRRSEMTLSMMTSSELETAEAILPFSALKKLGFILLFQVQQSNPEEPSCVASLSYIVPQDQQVFLYNKVPFLKFKAEELATQIKQNYIYSGAFPKTLANTLNNWRVTEKEATMEIEIVERKVTLSEKKEGGSIDFFFDKSTQFENVSVVLKHVISGAFSYTYFPDPAQVDYYAPVADCCLHTEGKNFTFIESLTGTALTVYS